MRITAVMIVRNEADILRVNVLHHLALGVDNFLIVDNGSSDATEEVLRELSHDGRVQWTRCAGAFRQAGMTTELAREAFLRGADWVLPVDADEFWHARRGDLRRVLEQSAAGALMAQVVNFIQRREQLEASPGALLNMTRRPTRPIGPLERIQELVETRQIGFVEIFYGTKCISRASLAIEIGQGNHSVKGVSGPQQETDEIVCLHAPLRARSILEAKVDAARPVDELREYLGLAWHVRRWRRLAEEGTLEQEWRANSYADDCLDVYGVLRRVVFDPRLRDLVAPWIVQAPPQRELSGRRVYAPPLKLGCAMASGEVQVGGNPGRPAAAEATNAAAGDEGTQEAENQAARREPAELRWLRERLARQEQGILFLRASFKEGLARRDAQVGERDAIIRGLQAELHAKVGERDQVIRNLQAELHTKLGEANQVICVLQAKLQAQTADAGSVPEARFSWLTRFCRALREQVPDARRRGRGNDHQ